MTKNYVSSITKDEFIRKFEALTLDPAEFSHLGHLKLAWFYLEDYPLEIALKKVCNGIKAYAESLGADTKFNLTLTDAFVKIIHTRRAKMAEKNWVLFLEQNTELIEDAQGVLTQYYSKELLFSDEAKVRLIKPDIRDIV